MAQKTVAGVNLEVSEDGYLVDSSKWNEEIAMFDCIDVNFVIVLIFRA